MDNKNFDLINSSLEGINFIEASAGTGKTYTISGLFIRLLIEKKIPVNKILVVTFTEAAIAELKERIRKRLRDAVSFFSGKNHLLIADDFLLNLKNKNISKETCNILNDALRSFDQASIFTIHGFCQKILMDNAFECSSMFDTELVKDLSDLKKEIIFDFYRKYFFTGTALFINYSLKKNINIIFFNTFLEKIIRQPDLTIIPKIKKPLLTNEENEYNILYQKLRANWPVIKNEIYEILLNNNGLNKKSYNQKIILNISVEMDNFISIYQKSPIIFNNFEKFTASFIKKSIKKNHNYPKHHFFDLCEELLNKYLILEDQYNKYLFWLKNKFINYSKKELKKRKKEKNIRDFNDLLMVLYKSLNNYDLNKLVSIINNKYLVALIDEFQDTDPIQFGIINKIFNNNIKKMLFLIGDPKQAIYGFRGADIYAYINALKNTDSRIYTLEYNYRSESGLVKAVNTIFKNVKSSFLIDEIPFTPAKPSEINVKESLTINNTKESPLKLWYYKIDPNDNSEEIISKNSARSFIPFDVANEISRLLYLSQKDKVKIGKKKLNKNDIAVLVRTNNEADLIKDALNDYNIPAVIYKTESIFNTIEAAELLNILNAIISPEKENLIKSALSTEMLGYKGEDIDHIIDTNLESYILKFKEYSEIWHKYGFMRMFKILLNKGSIFNNLILLNNGERKNTNLIQLCEILNSVENKMNINPVKVINWFSNQINSDVQAEDDYQLRLESDDDSIKIITIHKSKGMEFPIVFCPFSWYGSNKKKSKDDITFHDKNNNMILTMDMGSNELEDNTSTYIKEQLSEDLRLFYVALTRARNRCYIIWGKFKDSFFSAPYYLFHYNQFKNKNIFIDTIKFYNIGHTEILNDLESLSKKSDSNIELELKNIKEESYYNNPLTTHHALNYKKFTGYINNKFNITSFSSLIYKKKILHVKDIYNESNTNDEQKIEKNIFTIPKGTKTGILLHNILENFDFNITNDKYCEEIVYEKLKEYGFDESWQSIFCELIKNLLKLPLRSDSAVFTLSKIRIKTRLNELEFFFPLKALSIEKLKNIFLNNNIIHITNNFPGKIGSLDFSTTYGFMRGFIDLVFIYNDQYYIVDWKSNYLGKKVSDYNRNNLNNAMENSYYILQYHIYTIALHKYLSNRFKTYNYNKHFGGIFYIFLRGIDPNSNNNGGVFYDKPSINIINSLCKNLIAE